MRISHVLLTLSVLLGPPIAASSAAVDAVPSDLADLAGVYICTGKNFDGSTYEGVVEIVRQHDTFHLAWVIDSEVVALGMAIRTGSVLSVAYFAELPGVVTYRIEAGNRLDGEWTVVGASGVVSSETLTKVPPETLKPSLRPSDPEILPFDQRDPRRPAVHPSPDIRAL
jgi:hypothetical protein